MQRSCLRPALKLVAELKMTKAEYKLYLKSDHWKNLRAEKHKNPSRRRCGICGSREHIQTHHLRYKNIYDVETSDLRRLCGRCHMAAHELQSTGRLRLTSKSHQGLWCQTKAAVKRELGLEGNQFIPCSSPPLSDQQIEE